MESIRWPEDYLPGLTDNFVSNEVIVQGLSVEDVWEQLANPHHWPEYYENASDIRTSSEILKEGDVFFFRTFGFPVDAQVTECVPPGREAWAAGRACAAALRPRRPRDGGASPCLFS